MELFVLMLMGGIIFCLLGCIKGFLSTGEIKKLHHEIKLLHAQVKRIDGQSYDTKMDLAELKEQLDGKQVFLDPDVHETVVHETKSPEKPMGISESEEKSVDEKVSDKSPETKVVLPSHLTKEKVAEKPLVNKPHKPKSIKLAVAQVKKEKEPNAFDIWKKEWMAKFEGMNWETIIGTYMIPRLGALGITIAVFIFLAWAARQYGPGFRVVLGYGVSAALIGGGFFTENRYKDYSHVLFSAGLALTYFVTFATHFVEFAQIFKTPLPSLLGMAVIVGIWAGIAQKRLSPTIAMLVTLLGHFTIALAVFNLDNLFYAGIGIVILSAGSAFFLLWNSWYYVAAVGMLASYANHAALLSESPGSNTVRDFSIGMAVLTVYLLIFALSEMYSPETLRRKKIPSAVRSFFVTFNTAAFFALGSLMVEGDTFTEDYHHVFLYILSVVLLGLGVLYYLRRAQDPLYNIYFTKAVTILTFGLALHFSGNSLTTWLAIEMIVLLVSAQRSGLVVTRMLAHGLAVVVFMHGGFTILDKMVFMPYGAEGHSSTAVQSGFAVIAFWAFSEVYRRIDWSSRMRLGFKVPEDARLLLWRLDFVADAPKGKKEYSKLFGGLLFPYLYSIAAIVLCIGYSRHLVAISDRYVIYIFLALAFVGVGWIFKSRAYWLTALSLSIVSGVVGFAEFLAMSAIGYQDDGYAGIVLRIGFLVLALLGLALYSQQVNWRKRVDFNESIFPGSSLAYIHVTFAVLLSTCYALRLVETTDRFNLYGFFALSLLAGGWALNMRPYVTASFAFAGLLFLNSVHILFDSPFPAVNVLGIIALGICALATDSCFLPMRDALSLYRDKIAPYILYNLLLWTVVLYVSVWFELPSYMGGLLGLCVVWAGLSLVLHKNALALGALVCFLITHINWHLYLSLDGPNGTVEESIVFWVGIVGVLLSISGERFFEWRKQYIFSGLSLIVSFTTGWHLLGIEIPNEWFSVGMAVMALAYLVYAGLSGGRIAGVLSVLALSIATLVHLDDAFNHVGTMPLSPLVVGFLSSIGLWGVLERLVWKVQSESFQKLNAGLSSFCIFSMCVLSACMLERIPVFSDFYLTLSWSLLGLVLFGLALGLDQKFYRYAGLCVLSLAIFRVIFVDTSQLEAMHRVVAYGGLGVVLLGVGLGYAKAFIKPPSEKVVEEELIDEVTEISLEDKE